MNDVWSLRAAARARSARARPRSRWLRLRSRTPALQDESLRMCQARQDIEKAFEGVDLG